MQKYVRFILAVSLLILSLTATTPMACAQIRSDEKLTFFPTHASLSADGQSWNVPIHGWIYEPASSLFRRKVIERALDTNYNLQVSDIHKDLFTERVQLLLADNERNKHVTIRLAGKSYLLPASAKNGHITTTLNIPVHEISNIVSDGIFSFSTVSSTAREKVYKGRAYAIPAEGLSVISDIDDTIKHTSVLNRKKLLENTFYKPFQAVPGMSEFYQLLHKKHRATFHYVSSSPWHLFDPLQAFLTANEFPPAEFLLKDFRYKDKSFLNLFKKGSKTKPALIQDILKRFPQRRFILIGDSGEEDPEVYARIMNEFSDQIALCLIRNVTKASMDDSRFKALFSDKLQKRVHLFQSAKALPSLVRTRVMKQ